MSFDYDLFVIGGGSDASSERTASPMTRSSPRDVTWTSANERTISRR